MDGRIERSSARQLYLVRYHLGNELRGVPNCVRPVRLFQAHAVIVGEAEHVHSDRPGRAIRIGRTSLIRSVMVLGALPSAGVNIVMSSNIGLICSPGHTF